MNYITEVLYYKEYRCISAYSVIHILCDKTLEEIKRKCVIIKNKFIKIYMLFLITDKLLNKF